jgi:citrate lyase subunit beta/citryl-CoA lyase
MTDDGRRPAPRSALCVPGDEPAKLHKAFASDADQVVIDLEDAVAPARKIAARNTVADFLAEAGEATLGRATVRINAVGSPWWRDDLSALAASAPGLRDVVVPKTERAADLIELDAVLGGVPLGIQALVETALGVRDLPDLLAASDRIVSVVIGYADLAVDLRRPVGRPANPAWLSVQDRVVVVTRAAGVAPIDGPWFDFRDRDACVAADVHAAALGFDGKWVIHPGQVADVNAAFTPTAEQVERAQAVVAAFDTALASGAGTVGLEGVMLDRPVVESARQVIGRATRAAR